MSKDKFIQLFKKFLFWSIYTLFMAINLSILIFSLFELYYLIFDYEYWHINYTPSFFSIEKPSLLEYLNIIINIVFPLIFTIFSFFLLLKKYKAKALLILSLIFLVIVYNYINCYLRGTCCY